MMINTKDWDENSHPNNSCASLTPAYIHTARAPLINHYTKDPI